MEPPERGFLVAGGVHLAPLDIDTGPRFRRFAQRAGGLSADLGFANNFIWLTRMSAFYQEIEGCFCLFGLNGNRLGLLLPPLGEPHERVKALDACVAVLEDFNGVPGDAVVEYVDPDLLQRLGDTGGRWGVDTAPADYLYRSTDLIELRGNAYKTKRSEINQFQRLHPNHALEPLVPAHGPELRALLDHWLLQRVRGLDGAALGRFVAAAELERQGIERALRWYRDLELDGLALRVDGRLVGFTFGERIGPAVASVLVEKTDMAVAGAAQFLFRECARRFADCAYINAGDDMGMENLRRTKMSYRPALFAEKFTLRRLHG